MCEAVAQQYGSHGVVGTRPQTADLGSRWHRLALVLLLLLSPGSAAGKAVDNPLLIDDFSGADLTSALGTRWRAVSDQVMGGVSEATLVHRQAEGKDCLRLSGPVRLDNNGGFIQAALDLSPDGDLLDASAYTGLRISVRGNGEVYGLHLRSADAVRPWQSYRASFLASETLQTIELPFSEFVPHRLEKALDVSRLRRVGLVAIGRAFQADVSLCAIAFYR